MEKDLEYFRTMFVNKTALSMERIEDIQIAGKWLISKVEQYEKAFEYTHREIVTQHCTMMHLENTEYEKGKISGLIHASDIMKKAKGNFVR